MEEQNYSNKQPDISPSGESLFISVVIPFKNSSQTFEACLQALTESDYDNYEVVAVDDGSSDNSVEIAARFPVKIVPNEGVGGVASARNFGVQKAQGEVIFFIDSDVVVQPDCLSKLNAHFQDSTLDGVVGLQTADMRYRDFWSSFKNLWMRYTYIRLPERDLALFYTSVAAIRRECFLRTGGFDEAFSVPNVEDTVFGHVLKHHGLRIGLAKDVQVEHLKHYTYRSLLRTDFVRTKSLVSFMLGQGAYNIIFRNSTSVPSGYMLSSLLSLLIAFGVMGTLLWACPWSFSILVLSLVGFAAANYSYLSFLKGIKGGTYAVKGFLFLLLDIYIVDLGIVAGIINAFKGGEYYQSGQKIREM